VGKGIQEQQQLEREDTQRLEDMDTEGDDEGTVMLAGMRGTMNCTRANRKMRKHRRK